MHRAGEAEVAIEMATIHAVKGETHDATLVVETFLHEYDLELAVPFLLGKGSLKGKRLLGHLKRLFVGATRPKELLCFALHEDHVNPEQEQTLTTAGWKVARLG